ncbi:MAG: cell division protein FtsZ [Desulfatiglandales bacterium]
MGFQLIEENKGIKRQVRIKVIGVGGAGGNAINNMISSNLNGVELIVANTDAQDLERSECTKKILLGPETTRGNGCGGDPTLGEQAARESVEELKDALLDSDMVFIAAGMGGGTGTGASPVIAEALKEAKKENEGILTVAVVTKPFPFEGQARMNRAIEGIERLKNFVDSIIVIPNEKLLTMGGKTTRFKDLFLRADEVLFQAVKGISDLITRPGYVNLDFRDLRRVLSFPGKAIIGLGRSSGENKVMEATKKAISSPLLEVSDITGAMGLVMNFTGSTDHLPVQEVAEVALHLQGMANAHGETFWGLVFDETMGEEVEVTVVATGIDGDGLGIRKDRGSTRDAGKVLKIRDPRPDELEVDWGVKKQGQIIDMPSYEKTLHMESQVSEKGAKRVKKNLFQRLLGMESELDYPTFLRVKEAPEKG